MDSKVLAKIYKVSTSLNESVETIDNNLAKILKIEVKESKELKKERKEKEALRRRKEQLAKRKEKEVTNEKEDKQIKEEKKGFGDFLKDALGGLVSALGGIGGALKTALSGLMGVVGPVISAGLGTLGGIVGSVLVETVKGLSGIIIKGLRAGGVGLGIGGALVGAAVYATAKSKEPMERAMAEHRRETYGVNADKGTFATKLLDHYGRTASQSDRDRLLTDKDKQMAQLLRNYDNHLKKLVKIEQEIAQLEITQQQAVDPRRKKQILEEIIRKKELLVQSKQTTKQIESAIVIGGKDFDQMKLEFENGNILPQTALSRELYPTSGTGVDLNVTKLQTGGMVPTLLEPGEKVFTPGTWGPAIQQMNETFSRFQTGGIVQADHPDTGSGWSVGKDSQGRPSVFTKEAAEALAQAIRDSNGAVKTSDITSSKRSPDKNRAVGGVPNSNHLYGNAVDIHGTSKAWLKKNGPKYGWKNLVYSGHDGHFDFTKGATPIDEGNRERTADQEDANLGGKDIDGGQTFENLRFLGGVGGFIEGIAEGLAESGLGDIFGMLGGVGNAAGSVGGGILGLLGGAGGGIMDMFTGDSTSSGGGGGFGQGTATGEANGDSIAGAKMIMGAGVPKIGAAYLAGNIQQESSWNGQRDWGQVMGDGTSRNGGLVSWASWSDDPARLGKIEKHLGKNIKEASDSEQINAMLWEMKRDYPSAYATFMNPKASPAELRSASKAYWGYGHEGGRYGYSDSIYKRLQKGGIVDIGGIGFGDKIPMNLPEGSFVLNRKASAILNGTLSGSPQAFIERMKEAQENYNSRVAEKGSGPVVIVQDEAPPNVVATPEPDQDVPNLPNGPSMIQAAEYFYHLSLGGNN